MEYSDFAVSLPGLSLNMAVIYRPPDKSVHSFVSFRLSWYRTELLFVPSLKPGQGMMTQQQRLKSVHWVTKQYQFQGLTDRVEA